MPPAGRRTACPTGFPSLDRLLLGFREGQLIIIGARPAVGKTLVRPQPSAQCCRRRLHGWLLLARDERQGRSRSASSARTPCSPSRIFARAASHPSSGPTSTRPRRSSRSSTSSLTTRPASTVTEIRAKARRMLHNKEKAVIILDYLQLVSPPPGRRCRKPCGRGVRDEPCAQNHGERPGDSPHRS